MLSFFQVNDDAVFWFCALAGSGMFLIQFILNFIGIGEWANLEDSEQLDAGKFQWLSKQALMGFLMMFGWTAITCREEFGIEGISRIVISLSVGIFAMISSAWMIKMAKKLHSSGNVFKIDETIGKRGVVYQRIPPGGTGKISFSFNDFTHEIDAVSLDLREVSSFTQVKIIKKFDDKTVIVEAIEEKTHA